MKDNVATYSAPGSIKEAHKNRLALTERVTDIQRQLGSRNRTVAGVRMKEKAYWDWRQGAVYALQRNLAELWFVKNWISEQNRTTEAASKCHTAETLVAANTLLQRLKHEEEMEFNTEELSVISKVEQWVQQREAA